MPGNNPERRPLGVWWWVWCPDRGQDKEDGMLIVATYAEAAAVKWAERDDADSADYQIVRGNDATVLVAEDRDGTPEQRFTVSGESRPVYRARLTAAITGMTRPPETERSA